MHKARELGYEPQVIAAGRRVNDYMPHFIAKKIVQALIEKGKNPGECKVLMMGITFKEDVADIRNSKVVDLIRELEDYSVMVDTIDPHANASEVQHEYGIELKAGPEGKYDAIVVAVGHREYLSITAEKLNKWSNGTPMVFDVKGIMPDTGEIHYTRL
jgi:UDP-N-acetyl-D-galactosamine dehydrogenase